MRDPAYLVAGFLYVLANPSMPGLLKVGRTDRDPSVRSTELSGATGIPSPFLVVHHQAVSDSHAAEKWAHAELDARGLRTARNREFFRAPLDTVVEVVSKAGSIFFRTDEGGKEWTASADDLYVSGLAYRDGDANTLRDPCRALPLFEAAASMGHLLAADAAGGLHLVGSVGGAPDYEKALYFYRLAAYGGHWHNFAAMAAVFSLHGQRDGALANWQRFFESVNAVLKGNLPSPYPETALDTLVELGSQLWSVPCRTGPTSVEFLDTEVPDYLLQLSATTLVKACREALASQEFSDRDSGEDVLGRTVVLRRGVARLMSLAKIDLDGARNGPHVST